MQIITICIYYDYETNDGVQTHKIITLGIVQKCALHLVLFRNVRYDVAKSDRSTKLSSPHIFW